MRIKLSKRAKLVIFSLIAVITLGLGIYLETGVGMKFEITAMPERTERPQSVEYELSYTEDGKLDINMATVEELDAIRGIGVATAEKIIKYREENGPFDSIEELTNIAGIGENTIEGMRDSICVR